MAERDRQEWQRGGGVGHGLPRACHSREGGNLEARAWRQERGPRVGVWGCFVERRKDLGFPLKTAGMTEGSGNGREGSAGMTGECGNDRGVRECLPPTSWIGGQRGGVCHRMIDRLQE